MFDGVWFCSTKGHDDDLKITFISIKGDKRYFNTRQNFKGIKCFIKSDVKTIVSMEYSILRLTKICPAILVNVKLINLMQMFRELLVLFKDEHLNREVMISKLGYNIHRFEPDYPKSRGDQTCLTYQAIYLTLQELSEP